MCMNERDCNVHFKYIKTISLIGKADSKVNTEDEQKNEKTPYYFEITGGSWTTTTPSGFRVASVAGKEVKVQPILAYHATDPFSGTVSVLWFISLVSIVDCCNTNDTCIGCGHKRGQSAVCAEERWDGDSGSLWWDTYYLLLQAGGATTTSERRCKSVFMR